MAGAFDPLGLSERPQAFPQILKTTQQTEAKARAAEQGSGSHSWERRLAPRLPSLSVPLTPGLFILGRDHFLTLRSPRPVGSGPGVRATRLPRLWVASPQALTLTSLLAGPPWPHHRWLVTTGLPTSRGQNWAAQANQCQSDLDSGRRSCRRPPGLHRRESTARLAGGQATRSRRIQGALRAALVL